MKTRLNVIIFLLIFSNMLFAKDEQFNTERLPIGNPNTKFNFCPVKLNKIFDTNSGVDLDFDSLINKLKKYRVIMIGETHTNDLNHQVQLKIIKGLVEANQTVCLALEMFTPAQNQALNDYTSGKINEDEFLHQADYFNSWGHNYRYYKPIFDYAREKNLKMFGVNINHSYSSKIGRGGLKSLSEDERKSIPEIDSSNVEHRFFIKVAMEGMDATMPAQFRKIYAAQCLWDAAMGNGAIKVAHEHSRANVVVLAGSGHVAYNLGIGKIIKTRSNLTFASVVCVNVQDTVKESLMMKVKKSIDKEKMKAKKGTKKSAKMPPMGKMSKMMMTETPHKIVIASLADFLWGLPEEKREKYPSFGFSLSKKTESGFEVKRVIPETIAEKQGIKKGDIFLTIDDKDFVCLSDLKKYLHYKNWDETISFKILRDSEEKLIEFKIESVEDINKNNLK